MTPTSQAVPPLDAVELVNQVASFYEAAWSHLILVIAIGGGIIGIVIPLAIQWYQRRLFQMEEKAIEEKINAATRETRIALEAKLAERLKEELATFGEKLQRSTNFAQAGVFYVQGTSQIKSGHHAVAANSFAKSASLMFRSDDHSNVPRTFNQLNLCLGKITKLEFSRQPEIKRAVDDLLELLRKDDKKGAYLDDVVKIEKALRDAEQRDAPQA